MAYSNDIKSFRLNNSFKRVNDIDDNQIYINVLFE